MIMKKINDGDLLEKYRFNKKHTLYFIDFMIQSEKISKKRLFVESSKTIGIKKLEADFIINFLEEYNFLSKEGENLIVKSSYKKEYLFEKVSIHYFNLLLNNERVKKGVFIDSTVRLNSDRELILNKSSLPINLRPVIFNLNEFGFVKSVSNDDIIISNIDFAIEIIKITLNLIHNSTSQKEFDQILDIRKKNGELSELFVLEHEKIKLKNKNLKPIHCSVENVGLGYDIISYDRTGCQIFIEVKTLSKNCFFMTTNEVNTSKKLKTKYYIYCVEFKNGFPLRIKKIIQNPFSEIFKLGHYQVESSDYKVSLGNEV